MGGIATQPDLVGRLPELARLEDAHARAALGAGNAALIVGEAGIGKTRLVREFTDRASAAGAIVLRGECLESGTAGLPYGAIAQALHSAFATGRLDLDALPGAVIEQLAVLVPAIARRGDDDQAPFELAGLGQVRLFEALLTTIEHVSADRTLVLVVEDLHWADRSTLDLLTFLVRNVAATRCLVIATLRTDGVERGSALADTIAEMGRRPGVERLDLVALDRQETAAYLRALLGQEVDGRIVAKIHRRSDGNPFFVEQLAWAHLDGHDDDVPPSLRDILLNQLSRQPPDVQSLLGAAAVAGPRIDEPLLAAMLEEPESSIAPALRRAVQGHLLVPLRASGEETYPFRHALMAEAVEADLLEGERRRLRTRCADALQRRPPRDGVDRAQWAARIAHHRDLAGDAAGTVAASLVAAREAEGVAAHQDALGQYRRALAIRARDPSVPIPDGWDHAEIYVRAATCAAIAGDAVEAARLSGLALDHLPQRADGFRRGAILVDHAEYLWLAGDPRFVDALATPATVIPGEPPSRERADAMVSLGFHHKYLGARAEARQVWEEARATASRAGAPRVEALATACLAAVATEDGDLPRARALLDQAIASIRRAEPTRDVAVVYMDVAAIAGWAGDFEHSLAMSLEGLAVARRHGFESYYGGGLAANGAEGLVALGRFEEARALLARVGPGESGSMADAAYHTIRALVGISVGELERAAADLEACSAWLTRGDASVRRFLHVVMAEYAVETGRPGDVDALARTGLAIPPGHSPWTDQASALAWLWSRAAADRAVTARARRDAVGMATACALVAEAMDAVETILAEPAGATSPDRARARAYAALASAERARAAGTSDVGAWRRARASWKGRSFVGRSLYAQVREAEALLEAGAHSRADGGTVLRDAHALAIRYGAVQLRRMIEGIARRGRVELPASSPRVITQDGPPSGASAPISLSRADRPYGLTDRELEILGLLASGLTNRQIGERLFISPKTAGVHVSNILGKLEVGSRIQAATMAHHLGLESQEVPIGR